MNVLVIGGSVFLGRAVVAEALAAGHTVTIFHRGVSGPAPAGVTVVHGDRTVAADLDALAGRRFDLVVDTCGYEPADVTLSAQALAGSVGHYAFVSSISVYPQWPAAADYPARGAYVGDPDATHDSVPDDVGEHQHYGWLKAGCELAVAREFGGRCSLVRAGVIVGPSDSAVGRLPWWLDRFARGGEVLVPGTPSDPIALIDARDLARFALAGAAGTFEAGGPAGRDTWGDLVDALLDATGHRATPTWVDATWLAGQDVEPWTEIPLWTGAVDNDGTWAHDNRAAQAAGLRWRPLAETVSDTRAWQTSLPQPWTPTANTPGLAAATESELLGSWHRAAPHSGHVTRHP